IYPLSYEHGYEMKSAAAFSTTSSEWFVIEVDGVRGWLAPKNAGTFRKYENIIESGRSYLNAYWDGRLWDQPAGGTFQERTVKEGGNNPWQNPIARVKLLQAKEIDGKLWFEVQLYQALECASSELGE